MHTYTSANSDRRGHLSLRPMQLQWQQVEPGAHPHCTWVRTSAHASTNYHSAQLASRRRVLKQGTAAATTVDQIIDTRVFTPTAVLGDSCWRPEIWACYQNPGCVSTGRAGQFRVSHWLVWGQWHGAPTSVQRGLSTSSWAKAGHLWASHPAAWETWEKLQMYVVYKNKCCKDLCHMWAHPFAQKWVFTLISQREKKHAARIVYNPPSAAVSLSAVARPVTCVHTMCIYT